jgi:hypothetical protein
VTQKPVSAISSTLGLALYKKWPFSNNWHKFFRAEFSKCNLLSTGQQYDIAARRPINHWWAEEYSSLPMETVQSLIQSVFQPSNQVACISRYLLEKYSITLERTIGVHYRATDKRSEVETPSIETFIEKVSEAILKMPASTRIFLMTDEPEAIKKFQEAFPSKVVSPEELRAPGGTLGAHNVDTKDGQDQAQIFLACLLVVSKCRQVVTHTGNGAYWEFLWRGSSKGAQQLRGKIFWKGHLQTPEL